MRSLVTIQEILDIRSIPKADNIECAVIKGWDVVVEKNKFKKGDKGLYFEVDSFLPILPEFEFLRKSCYRKMFTGQEGFRIKTIKLKGQLSQGLLFPLPEDKTKWEQTLKYYSDQVVLWEIELPASLAGVTKGTFPSFIPKTDQERIQNLVEFIPEYSKRFFEVTEKLDGTSCTIYFDGEHFGVCSRNLELKESDSNTFWKLARKYDLEKKLREANVRMAIQGEVIGAGIQKNRYKLIEPDLYVFDIYDIDSTSYLNSMSRREWTSIFGLKHVPIIFTGISYPLINVEECLKLAEGVSKLNEKQEREGIVFKCSEYDGLRKVRISFKVINNKYLLKEKE